MALKNKILTAALAVLSGATMGQVKDTIHQSKDTAHIVKDTTDLMGSLEKEVAAKNGTNYTTATFKTTRLINGHTVENIGRGVMDVKISHRFGTLNKGGYELFGLDNATMRMGLDFGITPYLMVGIGRSTYQKTYDAFFKIKILRQSSGEKNMPITLSYIPTIALKTLHFDDPERKKLLFIQALLYASVTDSEKIFSQYFPATDADIYTQEPFGNKRRTQ